MDSGIDDVGEGDSVKLGLLVGVIGEDDPELLGLLIKPGVTNTN